MTRLVGGCLSICGILFSDRILLRKLFGMWFKLYVLMVCSCPTKEQCYWDVYGMEYVEPPIPDWISDNPFNGMSNWDEWDGEYGDDGYGEDGYNFLDDTEGIDEDAEGLDEEAEEEEGYDEAEKEYETKAETLAASKLEKSKLETPTPENKDEDDPFDLDGPLDDSDLEDSTDSDRDFSGPDLRKEILNKPLGIDTPPKNPKLEMS